MTLNAITATAAWGVLSVLTLVLLLLTIHLICSVAARAFYIQKERHITRTHNIVKALTTHKP